MPPEKQAAVAAAKTVDPSLVNTKPLHSYAPPAADAGPAALVDQAKAAAVGLMGDYYSAGSMPRDMAERHTYITSGTGKATRAAAIARVWTADRVADEVANLEKGMATFDGDTTSVGMAKAVFVVTSWQNVSVEQNSAMVAVTGFVRQIADDGAAGDDPTYQWQIDLVRGGTPNNYQGWRLDRVVHVDLPEGVTQ
jgi:hypothetical protein